MYRYTWFCTCTVAIHYLTFRRAGWRTPFHFLEFSSLVKSYTAVGVAVMTAVASTAVGCSKYIQLHVCTFEPIAATLAGSSWRSSCATKLLSYRLISSDNGSKGMKHEAMERKCKQPNGSPRTFHYCFNGTSDRHYDHILCCSLQ